MSGSTSGGNVIGSGSDSIVLNLSEDQADGQNAEFTVNVDGQQIGGVQTVTASHSAGQDEQFTFLGNFAPGKHDVAVTFINNLIWPGHTGDRNLYVDGVTYDGQSVSNTTTPIYNGPIFPPTGGPDNGNAVYQVNDTTSAPSGASANQTNSPGPVSVGSGPDTLVLNMAEDPYAGDAAFNVTVDGQQVGGTLTTTAIDGQGQYQEFDIHGNFGSGSHNVGVSFLNDAVGGFYPGTNWAIDTQDRNLYVMGASLDGGSPASGLPIELSNDGTTYFNVTSGGNSSATTTNSGLFGTDGAAASSSNPAIPSGAVASDSSSSNTSATATSASTSSSPSTDTNPSSSSPSTSTDTSTTAPTNTVTYTGNNGWQSALSGNTMFFINGSSDTADLSGGSSTVTDNGGSNTFVLPTAGTGTATFTNDILSLGDTLNLWKTLAGTNWDGSASDLNQYLSVTDTQSGATISVAPTAGGSFTPVATIAGETGLDLNGLLAHAIT